jgi:hypothetical protein
MWRQHKSHSFKARANIHRTWFSVTIWNVKTDNDGAWWVVQGDLPMNLYSQDKAYYFSTDEVFSFHLGIMLRLMNDDSRSAESFIEFISNGTQLSMTLKRKLFLASEKLNAAVETEEIQSVGVMCRETLIELINYVYDSDSFDGEDAYRKSDVKNRGELVIDKYLTGPENAELRKHVKNLLNGAWDYSNSITHSTSKSKYEASICLTMTVALVSSFENLLNKYFDPIAGLKCKKCGSRRLSVAKNDETSDLLIICENCRYGFLKSSK